MPQDSQDLVSVIRALDSVAGKLSQAIAEKFYREEDFVLPPGLDVVFATPRGTGGLLLTPHNGGDLANVTVSFGRFRFGFPSGSTAPQFVPFPGVLVSGSLRYTGTAGSTFPLSLATMSPEYAAGFAGQSLSGSVSLKGSLPPIQQVSSSALLPIGDGSTYNGAKSVPMPSHVELVSEEVVGANGNPWRNASGVGDGDSGASSATVVPQYWNGTSYDLAGVIPGQTNVLAAPYSGTKSVAITTATTTAVKASAGVVGTLSNASGAVTGTITVYDNTAASGKTLWSGTLAAGQVLALGIPCGTGITVLTAAADAIAVSYA